MPQLVPSRNVSIFAPSHGNKQPIMGSRGNIYRVRHLADPFPWKPVSLTAERERHPMNISRFGKSTDASDGFEQRSEGPTLSAGNGGQDPKRQWEDDGGPLNDQPPASVGDLSRKPAWSVMSLEDLNEARRRSRDPNDPVRVQQESGRVERARIRAIQARVDSGAAAARADRDRNRNDWEHT